MNHGIFASENDEQIAKLRDRMDHFYASTQDYMAFMQPSAMPERWAHVRAAISRLASNQNPTKILEFGAGRSGFSTWLGEDRERVDYCVQDVTAANETFLREHADSVVIGPLHKVGGPFDVIFSTFVFEHVSDPCASLGYLLKLLTPGGRLFIFAPRYDFPGYLSRSADHYSAAKRGGLAMLLITRRLWTCLSGQPAFLIHHDPALFHLPWKRDRDAIHWVSLFDLRAALRGRARLTVLPIDGGSFVDRFVKNYLQLNVVIENTV